VALGARFFGRYEHSLDAKGRLILPAKLRVHFTQPGFLTPHLEGCLALWTVEEFEKEIAIRLAQADEGMRSRNDVRDWSAAVFEAEIDRQGRMPIPTHLRQYAGLGPEVLVIGMINRVELWSPAAWEAKEVGDGPTASESV
jgi:MraZ protein